MHKITYGSKKFTQKKIKIEIFKKKIRTIQFHMNANKMAKITQVYVKKINHFL
jgi:hypothetical protein